MGYILCIQGNYFPIILNFFHGLTVSLFPLQCVIPPPATPSERPIPTLAPNIKVVTGIITRSASTILIIFVGVTIFLFGSLRIYDHARVIQLNMEIALISAHLMLLVPNFYTGEIEEPIPMVMEIPKFKHSKFSVKRSLTTIKG